MACNECTETKIVPTCIAELVIGIADPSTDYTVYIKNNSTGYVTSQDVASDSNGLITISTLDPYPDFYSPNFYYTIWVTEEFEGVDDKVLITIDGVPHECFLVRFEAIYTDDLPASFTSYSLSV